MKFNPLSWFKNEKFDIRFVDTVGYAHSEFPIRLAKNEPLVCTETQKRNTGKLKFHNCPGMIDYARYGYIMPAWQTIKIKANKAGTTAFYYNKTTHKDRNSPQPVKMAKEIVEGIFDIEDAVFQPWKCDSPWRIDCNKDISAFLMPAVYHSKFLNDLYVYYGIVDYKTYKSANFIFAPKRDCEVTINAGEPLLHIIPFYNKHISSGCSIATMEELSRVQSPIWHMANKLYQKTKTKKTFSLE